MASHGSWLKSFVRPGILIRRRAIYKGILGNSRFWRTVAIVMVGTGAFRRVFGKSPEVIDVSTMRGGNHIMQIATYDKQSRRDRRRGAA